ncbi:hypothetical protein D3C73_1274560 [compost metagenome]
MNAFNTRVDQVAQIRIRVQQVQEFHSFLRMLGVRGNSLHGAHYGPVINVRLAGWCRNYRITVACGPEVIGQRLRCSAVHEPFAGFIQIVYRCRSCYFRRNITRLVELADGFQRRFRFRRFKDIDYLVILRIHIHGHRHFLDDIVKWHNRHEIL